MKHSLWSKTLMGVGGLLVAASATACQAPVDCDAAGRVDSIAVTFTGDDSQVERVLVCTTDVAECVTPRQPGEPYASRAPGPWTTTINAPKGRTDEVDIYALGAGDKVLKKERVKVAWVVEKSDPSCGSTYTTSATVAL